MAVEILRDENGSRIGEIETRGDGIQIARDETGREKGRYDPKVNYTYDECNRRIGEGNQLSSLITRAGPSENNLLWGAGGYVLGHMTANNDSERSEIQNNRVRQYQRNETPAWVGWKGMIEAAFKNSVNLPEAESGEPTQEAQALVRYDNLEYQIEHDSQLTEADKLDVFILLNKRRKTVLQAAQSKGNCRNLERCRIEEQECRRKIEKICQDRKFEDAGWMYDNIRVHLKYNFNLTEAQKLDLCKLMDTCKAELIAVKQRADEALLNARKEADKSDVRARIILICILVFMLLGMLSFVFFMFGHFGVGATLMAFSLFGILGAGRMVKFVKRLQGYR